MGIWRGGWGCVASWGVEGPVKSRISEECVALSPKLHYPAVGLVECVMLQQQWFPQMEVSH